MVSIASPKGISICVRLVLQWFFLAFQNWLSFWWMHHKPHLHWFVLNSSNLYFFLNVIYFTGVGYCSRMNYVWFFIDYFCISADTCDDWQMVRYVNYKNERMSVWPTLWAYVNIVNQCCCYTVWISHRNTIYSTYHCFEMIGVYFDTNLWKQMPATLKAIARLLFRIYIYRLYILPLHLCSRLVDFYK